MNSLVERNLIQRSAGDLVAVAPHLRSLIYARISADQRRAFHGDASRLLEERANIIGAMRHAAHAREDARVLVLWLTHREDEIARRQANAAREILRTIAASDLPRELAPILQTARADLDLLLGDPEGANATLRTLSPLPNSDAEGYKTYLLARSWSNLGDNARAESLLNDALALLTSPTLFLRMRAHNLQGYLHLFRIRDLSQGRRVATNARIEAEVLQGWVEEASGNLAAARAFFAHALELAEEASADTRTLAYVHANLGRVLMNLNDTAQGIVYMQRAFASYEAIGNLSSALSTRINIAYAQTVGGDPQSALATATTGLEGAQRLREPYLIAGLAAAAGEAAVYSDNLPDAERYLALSLEQEEECQRPWALTSLGMMRARQNRHADAVGYLEAAAREAENIDDRHAEAYALYPLAISQRALDDTASARSSAARAHELYTALGMQKEIAAMATLLATLTPPDSPS